jgi:hypothetical protein
MEQTSGRRYRIVLRGELGDQFQERFGGMTSAASAGADVLRQPTGIGFRFPETEQRIYEISFEPGSCHISPSTLLCRRRLVSQPGAAFTSPGSSVCTSAGIQASAGLSFNPFARPVQGAPPRRGIADPSPD